MYLHNGMYLPNKLIKKSVILKIPIKFWKHVLLN